MGGYLRLKLRVRSQANFKICNRISLQNRFSLFIWGPSIGSLAQKKNRKSRDTVPLSVHSLFRVTIGLISNSFAEYII